MKKEQRSFRMYLEDILVGINRIEEYVVGYTFSDFQKDYKTVDAVNQNFEVIGEAAKNILDKIKLSYHEVPWAEIYLLRNKVSHEYFGIDHEIIWDVLKTIFLKTKPKLKIS